VCTSAGNVHGERGIFIAWVLSEVYLRLPKPARPFVIFMETSRILIPNILKSFHIVNCNILWFHVEYSSEYRTAYVVRTNSQLRMCIQKDRHVLLFTSNDFDEIGSVSCCTCVHKIPYLVGPTSSNSMHEYGVWLAFLQLLFTQAIIIIIIIFRST